MNPVLLSKKLGDFAFSQNCNSKYILPLCGTFKRKTAVAFKISENEIEIETLQATNRCLSSYLQPFLSWGHWGTILGMNADMIRWTEILTQLRQVTLTLLSSPLSSLISSSLARSPSSHTLWSRSSLTLQVHKALRAQIVTSSLHQNQSPADWTVFARIVTRAHH